MIEFSLERGRKALIVTTPGELLDLRGSSRMCLDVETTAFNKKDEAFYPYLGHRICGVAVTVDRQDVAYYVPLRHANPKWNIDLSKGLTWLRELLAVVPAWINHNIKFDAHFCRVDDAVFRGEMIDTAVMAKLYDSDRMGHELKPLCRDWLGLQMFDEGVVEAYLKSAKTHNYAEVPADILGKYACADVFGARDLYDFLEAKLPPELNYVKQMERQLTPVLFDIECEGMDINPTLVKQQQISSIEKLIELQQTLLELTGREYADSAQCNYDILVNRFGLPVLAYNENGNPSFDGDTMKSYTVHPAVMADTRLKTVVDSMVKHREVAHFKSLFLDALAIHGSSGVAHPSYNQVIRTGRMSCKKPNAQQFQEEARELVIAREGEGMLSADASQIEFRLIVHYIKDATAIEAYRTNPRTDYHQHVADQLKIKRKPAKTVNFAMGYGAGKRRVLELLSFNPDIVESVGAAIKELVATGKLDPSAQNAEFKRLCAKRASDIYEDYHAKMPTMKSTANMASAACATRGYSFNAYGRRRHLPAKAAHIAFNAVVQGCAMDYIKGRMIALSPRYNPRMKELGLRMFVNVHDEISWKGPLRVVRDPRVWREINQILIKQEPVQFRVPLMWDFAISDRNWRECKAETVLRSENGVPVAGKIPAALVD